MILSVDSDLSYHCLDRADQNNLSVAGMIIVNDNEIPFSKCHLHVKKRVEKTRGDCCWSKFVL